MKSLRIVIMVTLLVGSLAPAGSAIARTLSAPDVERAAPAGGEDTSGSFWQHWTTPLNVSLCPANKATYPTLGLSSDGGAVYLAWTDGRAVVKDIYYATSTDGGWQWGGSQPVVATAADSWRPSLVVSGTTPLLTWAESVDGLNRTTQQLTLGGGAMVTVPNAHTVLAYAPRLASGPAGELHLALQGGLETQPDILYSRRDPGATTWPTATVIFTHTASGSYDPAIAVGDAGQSVHVVWQENFSGNQSAIYYRRGTPSGPDVVWGAPLSLSTGITQSMRPAVAVWSQSPTSQTVYVAWGEETAGYAAQYVRFSRSDDGGASWSVPRRVDAQPVSANNVAPTDVAPALAIAPSGAVCVAWHGFRPDAAYEAEEVYLSCSTDQGDSWGTPVNVSSSATTISIRPVLAIGADGILSLAWQELAGSDPVGDYQIYYARSLPYAVMLPLVMR